MPTRTPGTVCVINVGGYLLVTALLLLFAPASRAELEEIVVTSSLVDQSPEHMSTQLHVIDGKAVQTDASRSLGETINDLPGVASSDYGAAVGQPIIRGLSGARVQVLQNGMVVRDSSQDGPDHQNDVSFLNLQQIEIIKGPASLLHANGVIGGIVNIVDNTIAKQDVDRSSIRFVAESQSVNNGASGEFVYTGNLAGLNLALAYSSSDLNFYDIPSDAIPEGAERRELDDSDYASTVGKSGISKVWDWGHIGLSYSNSDSVYGVPFHGEEEAHAEEEEEHAEEAHVETRVYTETDSQVVTLDGAFLLQGYLLQGAEYFVRLSDYASTENELGEHVGITTFTNDSEELGLQLDIGSAITTQKLVFNFSNSDTGSTGSETFLPQVDSRRISLGYFFSRDFSPAHIDLGVRYDQIDRDTTGFSFDDETVDVSLAMSRDITDSLRIGFNVARVTRAPSPAELYADGPHLARQRFEQGNSDLEAETANNFDLSLDFNSGDVFSTLSFFRNRISNYIYLQDEHEDEHEEEEHEEEEEEHAHGELIRSMYMQQNAEFIGYEFELGRSFRFWRGELMLSVGRDQLWSKFRNGEYLPRAVPVRNFFRLTYQGPNELAFHLTLKDVEKQRRVAEGETVTAGYQMLDMKLSRDFSLGRAGELTLSLFAKNLLNKAARNHSSFVKDEVPLPGRNIGLRLNYRF